MGHFTWITGDLGFRSIQLDIVGFLAVLGEGSVLANAQVASLSRITYLPRLMPAPQALLRPSRPKKLEAHAGFATSIHSGNDRHNINHVGHILVDAESYKDYSVRCVNIRRKQIHELHKREHKGIEEDTLTAHTWGPLTFVAITGCAFSVIIFAVAVWQRDGMAMLADILLSFLSTTVAIATKWRLTLPKRKMKIPHTPPGDVAIRYTKGSFLIVQCDEDVARELYFAPENIDYLVHSSWQYRMISLVGTIMLMFGVIFLGNAQVALQLAFAGAYIIMNALYWIVAALPNHVHWDTSCFEVQDQCIQLGPSKLPLLRSNSKEVHDIKRTIPSPVSKKHRVYVDFNENFTSGLWKAIVVTKSVEWIRRSNTAPDTPAWNEWLAKAEVRANETGAQWVTDTITQKQVLMWELPDWEPMAALTECMLKYSKTNPKLSVTPEPPLLEEDSSAGAEKHV